MTKAILAGALAIALVALASFAAGGAKMKITSSAFQEGGNIPSKFTCDGGDSSPPLQIAEIPSSAKSLALVVDDPDAPSGLFTHWIVWNISPQTNGIAEGSTPKGVQGTNDFGKAGYGGPCPPSGTHRYYVKIFALDRRAGFAPWHEAESAGCSNERSCCCAGGVNGALRQTEAINSLIVRTVESKSRRNDLTNHVTLRLSSFE